MTQTPVRTHEQSILVEATPVALYDMVSDITRTGEWSPICTACWWDDPGEAGQIGAWFTGHNELPDRIWETRSRVAAADRGREFAWIVGRRLCPVGLHLRPRRHGDKADRKLAIPAGRDRHVPGEVCGSGGG